MENNIPFPTPYSLFECCVCYYKVQSQQESQGSQESGRGKRHSGKLYDLNEGSAFKVTCHSTCRRLYSGTILAWASGFLKRNAKSLSAVQPCSVQCGHHSGSASWHLCLGATSLPWCSERCLEMWRGRPHFYPSFLWTSFLPGPSPKAENSEMRSIAE